jgi:hypothetical protein
VTYQIMEGKDVLRIVIGSSERHLCLFNEFPGGCREVLVFVVNHVEFPLYLRVREGPGHEAELVLEGKDSLDHLEGVIQTPPDGDVWVFQVWPGAPRRGVGSECSQPVGPGRVLWLPP